MASGSFDLTTYYAKRIIGDTAATTYNKALLYAGSGINSNMWIFGHNRPNYGIKYVYQTTNDLAEDQIEIHGGDAANTTARIKLRTGDIFVHDITGGGALAITGNGSITGNLTVAGTSALKDTVTIGDTTQAGTLRIYSHTDGNNQYYQEITADIPGGTAGNRNWTLPAVANARYFMGTVQTSEYFPYSQYGIVYANYPTAVAVLAPYTATETNPLAVLIGSNADTPSWRAITDIQTATAIAANTTIPTMNTLYYGLPTINNSHAYNSTTTIYAPSDAGTAGNVLVAQGNDTAPAWYAGLSLTGAGTSTSPYAAAFSNTVQTGGNVGINVAPDDTYTLKVSGQSYLNSTTASSTNNLSSQLIVANSTSNGANVAIELWRGGTSSNVGSWQIANESAYLYFRSNWYKGTNDNAAKRQDTYGLQSLKLFPETGNGAIPGLAIGQTTQSTSYKLYVNGTSKLDGDTEVGGDLDPATTASYSLGALATAWDNIVGNDFYVGANGVRYGRFWASTEGTTTTTGWTILAIGNETATGTANNARGSLRIYSTNNLYQSIVANEPGGTTPDDRAWYLPSVAGNRSFVGTTTTGFPYTQYGVCYAGGDTYVSFTGAGTAGYLLQAGGSSAAPSWIQATNANTASTIVKRDASGNFSAGTITASLSGNATSADKVIHTGTHVTYISGAAGNSAAVYAKKATGNVWAPAVTLQTSGGGAWQIGNYNDETLEFVYATSANISGQTNTTTQLYMTAGDTGRIATSGNVDTGDSNGQVKIAGTNVSVKGLGSAAYTASTAYATSGHTHGWANLTDNADSLSSGSSDVTASTEILTSYASNNGFSDTSGKGKVYRRAASKVVNATLVKAALGTVSTTAKKFLKDTGSFVQVDWDDLTGKPSTFAPSSHNHASLVNRTSLTKGTNPSGSTSYYTTAYVYETGTGTATSNRLAWIGGGVTTEGRSFYEICAYKFVSGSTANNYLSVGINADGTAHYGVGDAAAFRTAISASSSDHTHGNITNGGCITTAITLAADDYIIVGDNSASGKLGKGPVFDGSTTTKCLTQKGTWASFTNNAGTVTSITLSEGAGISLSATGAITTSGTRTISIDGMNTSSGSTTKWLNQKGGWTTPTAANVGAPSFVNGTTNNQLLGFKATTGTHNSSYSSYNNHELLLMTTTTGLFLWDSTDSSTVWSTASMVQSALNSGDINANVQLRTGVTKGTQVSSSNLRYVHFLETGTGTAEKNRIASLLAYQVGGTLNTRIGFTVRKSAAGSTDSTHFYLAYDWDGTNEVKRTYTGAKIYGAVWNDYAEFRKTLKDAKPGQVVIDNDDGSLSLTTERLQIGAQVVTDTFGFAIGETENTKTPLAVSGRVLVNTYRNRYEYHAGQSVCSAPDGTVDIMSRDEIMMYPDAIVGIVSEIPEYEVWGEDNVPVNGRIWIRVR